jgi:hypothetical protein
MQMTFNATEEQKEALKKIIDEPEFPPMPPELKAKIEEAERRRINIEKQVWKQVVSRGMKDLLGDPIMPETHEIRYDMEPREINGHHFMVATQMYIQPKRSELLNDDGEATEQHSAAEK